MDDHGETGREKEAMDFSTDGQVSRRKFLGLVGLTGATVAVGGGLGALVTGCGGDSTSSTTSTQSGSSSGSTASPKRGGTLKILAGLAAGTAGGWPSSLATMSDDARPALETLIRIDKDGTIVPWLAESYTVAADSKSITFKLRQAVTFHDKSVFNAEVVKWNIDNVIAAKSSEYFASVDILDPYTIRLNLTKWSNLVWSDLYETGYTLMASKAAFDKNGKDWMTNHPVGTGPFMFESFQQGVSLKLLRNPSYWKKDAQGVQLPYLDGIEIDYMPDAVTQKMTMKARQADMNDISIVDGRAATDYKNMGLQVDPIIGASLGLVPDTGHADSPFAKQEVREALDYAIDREAIAKNFAFGMWKAQYQIPGPACGAYNSDFAYGHKYDPVKAKQLLTTAGYPNGFATTVVVMPITGNGKDIYLALQSYLTKVGIKAELLFTDSFPAYMDAVNNKHSILNATQLIDNNANFSVSLNFILGENSMFNKNWQRTAEFEQLFNASLTSPKADVKLIRAVSDYLSQHSQIIPFAGSGRAWAKWPYVKNLGAGDFSMPAFWRPEQVWLDK